MGDLIQLISPNLFWRWVPFLIGRALDVLGAPPYILGSQQWSLVKIDIKDLKFLKETYSPPPPLRFPHTTYGKIRIDDDLRDLSSVEAEFPAIVINDAFAPQDALQCKSQVSTPFNNEINFRISFDEFDDEDFTQ
ncbi:hypothetical protein Tco_0761792 [Tanacetum coccineum]